MNAAKQKAFETPSRNACNADIFRAGIDYICIHSGIHHCAFFDLDFSASSRSLWSSFHAT